MEVGGSARKCALKWAKVDGSGRKCAEVCAKVRRSVCVPVYVCAPQQVSLEHLLRNVFGMNVANYCSFLGNQLGKLKT